MFDRWAAIYPDELETLYQKTPLQMRDSTSVLIGLKRMLDATRSLKPGDRFVDQTGGICRERQFALFRHCRAGISRVFTLFSEAR